MQAREQKPPRTDAENERPKSVLANSWDSALSLGAQH
jgi:hypothetical protein